MAAQLYSGVISGYWAVLSIKDLAPSVLAAVPARRKKCRTVTEALQNHSWPTDIQGDLSLVGLFEYFQLWDVLQEIALSDDDD
ncbi:hypothetical protein PR202_ga13589 [Eleusine coracana subsp. coracana]|uniref:Uncharacterized protein n=1 Tax=Eleusine coracana subsp. coracana TaxID=191504 RepID=A0AAV5CFB1_ELECO|nr:hypothetical protein PR202_ga13589 [Eleusine coracana subsp. coracana]